MGITYNAKLLYLKNSERSTTGISSGAGEGPSSITEVGGEGEHSGTVNFEEEEKEVKVGAGHEFL